MDTEPQSNTEISRQYEPIRKSDGVTPAEKYLGGLCTRTFLSLWSYPGVYRDEGKPKEGGHGKEICDLLVVFDEHVIIFSDKHCELKNSGNLSLDWQRWFKNAIQKSAAQAWGAEKWIRQHPAQVFLDRECKQPLPVSLPEAKNVKFHLVVVAHGISSRIKQLYGGSGSLFLNTRLEGFQKHTEPFSVGDLAPEKTFVHVLDDYSLDILMSARDTISDFVSYLTKREILLRGQCRILATGEEQLLACYLVNLDGNKEHNFVFPAPVGTVFNGILLTEGHWEDFQNSPQRIEQLKQDEVSYAWDELIEKFSYYALRGEQDFVTAGGFKDAERIFRFMAREPRVKRRYFAKSLLEMIYTTPINVQNLRVIPPLRASDPYYVFLLLPAIYAKTYDEYRDIRRRLLEDCCLVTKLVYPDAKDIIGIATETDPQLVNRSEDSLYIDAREWDAQMESETKKIQMELGILTRPKKHHELIREFPDPGIPSANMKNPRNKPCPCGSGKKFKHCCLNK